MQNGTALNAHRSVEWTQEDGGGGLFGARALKLWFQRHVFLKSTLFGAFLKSLLFGAFLKSPLFGARALKLWLQRHAFLKSPLYIGFP